MQSIRDWTHTHTRTHTKMTIVTFWVQKLVFACPFTEQSIKFIWITDIGCVRPAFGTWALCGYQEMAAKHYFSVLPVFNSSLVWRCHKMAPKILFYQTRLWPEHKTGNRWQNRSYWRHYLKKKKKMATEPRIECLTKKTACTQSNIYSLRFQSIVFYRYSHLV